MAKAPEKGGEGGRRSPFNDNRQAAFEKEDGKVCEKASQNPQNPRRLPTEVVMTKDVITPEANYPRPRAGQPVTSTGKGV
jgi:hypothetical protein